MRIKTRARAANKLQEFNGERIHTTTITLAELYRGAYDSQNVSDELSKIDRLLQDINVLTLNKDSAKKYGEFHKQLKSNPIEDADLYIASIVVSNNETLLTKNVGHFERISPLVIISW